MNRAEKRERTRMNDRVEKIDRVEKLKHAIETSVMRKAVPWSEYERDRELREWWHKILDNKELIEMLPSKEWRGYKLQEILWSGKIKEEEGWEEDLMRMWKE